MAGIPALAATVWGIDADVFGAWGQWAGALVGGVAASTAVYIAGQVGRRRRRDIEDQQAAQARTITATVALAVGLTFPRKGWSVIQVANHGQLPVTDVQIHELRHQPHSDGPLIEAGAAVNAVPGWLCSVLGPGDTATTAPLEDSGQKLDVHGPSAQVEISFVDAKGLRWRRNDNGEPARIFHSTRPRRHWLNPKRRQAMQSAHEVS